MTKIKLCGLSRDADIDAANRLLPEYIGFVFAEKSRRYISRKKAEELKKRLNPAVLTVGVFVNSPAEEIVGLLQDGVIDLAQLHGQESSTEIARLRELTGKPVIRAFRVRHPEDVREAEASPADLILLDAGAGDGKTFDWEIAGSVRRPYFLAGGLTPENAGEAVRQLHPYALDVSSGIETGGVKDPEKMRSFMRSIRGTEK